MSIIAGLIDWIKTCPQVKAAEYTDVYVDLTAKTPANMSVAASHDSVVKQYMDGSCLIEHDYVLFLKQEADENQGRLEHNEFLEEFAAWVWRQNRLRNYPNIGNGLDLISIRTANGMFYEVDQDGTGIYQVQIKMKYIRNYNRK